MNGTDRRSFIKGCLAAGGASCFGSLVHPLPIRAAVARAAEQPTGWKRTKALHFDQLADKMVKCRLCPRECTVADRERGYCGVRENADGTYYTLVHSRPCTLHVDPIEKKPLFHFLPSTSALSLATAGCNIHCKFCQNWEISQVRPEQIDSIYLPPDKLSALAQQKKCGSIAFTYSEPVVFFEYVLDTARAAKGSAIRTAVISNGYINPKPLAEWCESVDAIKVDLKAFTESFYKDYCDGELKPVLKALETIVRTGTWCEIVTLLLPGLNDSAEEVKKLSDWVVEHLGPDVPLHFTRFHPIYQIQNLPPTPQESILAAREIAAKAGVRYVYTGNVPGSRYENTVCHNCGTMLVSRFGFYVRSIAITDGACPKCKTKIPGIWK